MKRIQQTLKGWADEASSGIHPGRAIKTGGGQGHGPENKLLLAFPGCGI